MNLWWLLKGVEYCTIHSRRAPFVTTRNWRRWFIWLRKIFNHSTNLSANFSAHQLYSIATFVFKDSSLKAVQWLTHAHVYLKIDSLLRIFSHIETLFVIKIVRSLFAQLLDQQSVFNKNVATLQIQNPCDGDDVSLKTEPWLSDPRIEMWNCSPRTAHAIGKASCFHSWNHVSSFRSF